LAACFTRNPDDGHGHLWRRDNLFLVRKVPIIEVDPSKHPEREEVVGRKVLPAPEVEFCELCGIVRVRLL
jgi:hypothetical protein